MARDDESLPPGIHIRPVRPTDYPAAARVLTNAHPWQPASSPDLVRHIVEMPSGTGPVRFLVAEARGEVMGYGMLRHFPTVRPLWVYVTVDPVLQRRGIGSRLLERLLESAAGVEEVAALVWEASPGGPPFAIGHGFTEAYRARESALALADFDPDRFAETSAGLLREGITFAALDEVDGTALRHELHELVNAASADIPTPDPYVAETYEEFARNWFDSPRAHFPTLVLALHEGHPVAFSNITVENGDAGYNNGTGVARAFRGRGLGTAVKVEALRRAKAHGVREVRTDNDTDNAPMLAINARLGYRPLPDLIRFVKRLAP